MRIIHFLASILRSIPGSMRRILASPWKDSKESEAFKKLSSDKAERPSTVSVKTNSCMQKSSKSLAQIETNARKKIEPNGSLPTREVISSTTQTARSKDTTSLQSVGKSIADNKSPESYPDTHYFYKEQKSSTENCEPENKNLNETSVKKQLGIKKEDLGNNLKILESIEPISKDFIEDSGQLKESQLAALLQQKEQQRKLIENKSKKADKVKTRTTKYRPPKRTSNSTEHIRNKSPRQAETTFPRVHTLRMCPRVLFGRRNQLTISLLPERTEVLSEKEKVEIKDQVGQISTWFASQDEWYCDVTPLNLGELLKNGGYWESNFEDKQLRWVLSGREIYVLASSLGGTISGYISVTQLVLFKNHLVLCTKQREKTVRQALADAGCIDLGYVSDESMLPEGWVLFSRVYPTVAITHNDSSDILNVLRPIHDIEIILQGGIRLSHNSWLYAHPPAISIRGTDSEELDVMINGNIAHRDDAGKYTAKTWDELGSHIVFCGGVTQSYELTNVTNEWEFFNAYSYIHNLNDKKTLAICGPSILLDSENGSMSLAPSKNTCIIGAVPGQITMSAIDQGIGQNEYLAVADFPIVWVLPPSPLTCKKSSNYVRMISFEQVVECNEVSNRKVDRDILRWCWVILDASRKRLRVKPQTIETKQLWTSYVKVAHRYWKRL